MAYLLNLLNFGGGLPNFEGGMGQYLSGGDHRTPGQRLHRTPGEETHRTLGQEIYRTPGHPLPSRGGGKYRTPGQEITEPWGRKKARSPNLGVDFLPQLVKVAGF